MVLCFLQVLKRWLVLQLEQVVCAPHSVCSNAAWERERSPGVTGGTKSGSGLGFPSRGRASCLAPRCPLSGRVCAFLFHSNEEKVWKKAIKCHLDPVLENTTSFFGKEHELWRVGKRGQKVEFHLSPGRPVRLMVLLGGEGGGPGT